MSHRTTSQQIHVSVFDQLGLPSMTKAGSSSHTSGRDANRSRPSRRARNRATN